MLPLLKMGVGTWAWGNQLIWDYGTNTNEESLRQVFRKSVQDGVRFFSTSEAFSDGESERILGRLLAESPEPVFLATKYVPRVWRFRRSDFLRHLQLSLKRLGRQEVDLYQVLPPAGFMGLKMFVECAAEAVDAGLIRNVGVSNFSAPDIEKFSEMLNRYGIPLTCAEAEYNLLNREVERNGVLDACKSLNIPLIAQSPLAMGLLTGKYLDTPVQNGLRREMMRHYPTQGLSGLIRQLNAIGSEHSGKNSGQVALNWLMQKGAIPIPGAKTLDQVAMNNLALGWELTAEQVTRLDYYSAEMAGLPEGSKETD